MNLIVTLKPALVFVNAYWRLRMEHWEYVREHWRKWPEARVPALAL